MKRTARFVFTFFLTLGMFLSIFSISSAQEETMGSSTVQPDGSLPGDPQIDLVRVAGGLADPVNVASANDGSGRLFIVERTGTIRIVQDGEVLDEPFLDISQTVKTDFLEQGLLGLAFHPNYAENGRLFVYYTDWNTNGDSYLVEYRVSADDANKVDPDSAKALFTHDQPYINHNGGTIRFGPDGYMYWSMGDGGLAGDPYENAQDISTVLGSILRIDVDSAGPNAYAIPESNPFAQGTIAGRPEAAADYHPDAAPEIWAYGLRNPWQFSFDPANGDLYIADVGQNVWEEVNYQSADSQGGVNYGWDALEASHCYPSSEESCDSVGMLPVAEFSHEDGSCSITGGGVYRSEAASLNGVYLNSDFCSGKVWGLTQGDDGWVYAELLDTDLSVTGSGMDADGNVYFTSCNCEYGRNYDPLTDPQGAVWQVVAADMVPADAESAPKAAVTTASEQTEASASEANEVQVSLVEWAIQMPNELPAGETTFIVTNEGEFDHNIEITNEEMGVDWIFDQDLESGETQSMTVDLAPGEYYVYCPIGTHAAEGMELTLTVTE